MSNLAEKTPAMLGLEAKRALEQLQEEERLAELEKLIPKPVGWSILIAIPVVDETYTGGLLKAEKTIHREHVLSAIGLVIDMGAQAYTDKDRFSMGPWCKVGDYVMFRPNSGTRFKLGNTEYRLLNDDSIEATVPNPKVISSAI